MKYHKKMAVIIGVIGFVIIGIASSRPPGEFRNLKVLPKNISEQRLDTVMNEFAKALGVECNFCHVQSAADTTQWDMASDEKPEKQIARKMISMSNKINQKFFHGKSKYGDDDALMEIHCITCHRGQPHPEMEEMQNENSDQ